MKRRSSNTTGAPMPKAPNAHLIGREATTRFIGALPASWTHSEPRQGDDYGVDITCSIFDDGEATGRLIHLQVKGLSKRNGKQPKIPLKLSTRNYLQAHSNASGIVVVDIETDTYWFMSTSDDPCSDAALGAEMSGKSAFSIRFEERHQVSKANLGDLLARHSYRCWAASVGATIEIQCIPKELTAFAQTKLGTELPQQIRFVAEKSPSTQASLSLYDADSHLLDIARPWKRYELKFTADETDFLYSLVALLNDIGMPQLAARALCETPALTTNAIERHEALIHLLAHTVATPSQHASFIRAGIRHHCTWAARWLEAAAERFSLADFSTEDVLCAFKSSNDWDIDSRDLVCIEVLAMAGHKAAAAEQIWKVAPPRSPNSTYRLAHACQSAGLYDRALDLYAQASTDDDYRSECEIRIAHIHGQHARFDAIKFSDPDPKTLNGSYECLRYILKTLAWLHPMTIVNDEVALVEVNVLSADEKQTDIYYRRMSTDGKSGDQRNWLLAGMSMLQSIRRGALNDWADALSWLHLIDDDVGEIAYALMIASAQTHGGDALRIAMSRFPDLADEDRTKVLLADLDAKRGRQPILAVSRALSIRQSQKIENLTGAVIMTPSGHAGIIVDEQDGNRTKGHKTRKSRR